MNVENNRDITLKELVGVCPTFKFYPKSNKDGEIYYPGKFEGNWDVKNITKFLNVHCQTKRMEDGFLDKMVRFLFPFACTVFVVPMFGWDNLYLKDYFHFQWLSYFDQV